MGSTNPVGAPPVTTGALIDLRDGDAVLTTIIQAVQRHVDRPLGWADVELDLEVDLGLGTRQRYEVAGELAERTALPGADDDTVNALVLEALALRRTMCALASGVAGLCRHAATGLVASGSAAPRIA